MVSAPIEEHDLEVKIRDINDRPILRAAINSGADILLTGDKDFIESGIYKPKVMTAAEFVDKIQSLEVFMSDLSISDMLAMQQALQDKYKDKWEEICPNAGKHKLLWMIGEIGEVIDIIKKNGHTKVLDDRELRQHLVEEMADVLMYYNDVLLCYSIGAEELKEAYTSKF